MPKGQPLVLQPGEGDLLDAVDADGQPTVISITGLISRIDARIRQTLRTAPGEVDVMQIARQEADFELKRIMPGVQADEWVGGDAPRSWVARVDADPREALLERNADRRERFPDVEAVDAGLAFIGERGLRRDQVRVTTTPLGDRRSGAAAMRIVAEKIDVDPEWAPMTFESRASLYHRLQEEGQYSTAQEIAIDSLPRDTGKLREIQRAGGLWDFTDHGDGTYSVQLEEFGQVYPLYATEEGDEQAFTEMWFPDPEVLLAAPAPAAPPAMGPGGAPDVPSPPAAPIPSIPFAPWAAAPEPPAWQSRRNAEPVSVPQDLADNQTSLTELMQEWDALEQEYLDVNQRLNQLDPDSTNRLTATKRRGLERSQATLAEQRRALGERITKLRKAGAKAELLREQQVDLIDEGIQVEDEAAQANNTVLDAILDGINRAGFWLADRHAELQAMAGYR